MRVDQANRVSDDTAGGRRHDSSDDWPARARTLSSLIESAADRIERERQVPKDVMSALHEARLFRMCLPRFLDGGEASPRTILEVLEIVAAADASTAWCLGQGLGCSLAAAFVAPDVAREVFGRPDAVLAWGPVNPRAKAVAADGGYRVSGEFRFASGSRNATWLGATCPVYETDGTPRLADDGRPAYRTLLFPFARATVSDVWQVIGLKGTGSDDYALADVFVPEAYSYVRDSPADRRETSPLYRLSLTAFYGISFASVALGIARASLDAFIRLAATKVARDTAAPLRENAVVQSEVALAEARLRSARAFLIEMIDETWETARVSAEFPLEQRARLRIASTYAIRQARDVVDSAYYAAGSTAIFEKDPFERRFRDMHTVAQQIQGAPSNFEQAGAAFLGLTPRGSRL